MAQSSDRQDNRFDLFWARQKVGINAKAVELMGKHGQGKQVRVAGGFFLALLTLVALSVVPRTSSHQTADRVARATKSASHPGTSHFDPRARLHYDRPSATSVLSAMQSLSFEPNQGQTDRAVKFFARGPGYNVFLMPTEAVFALGRPEATKRGPTAGRETTKKRRRPQVSVVRVALKDSNPRAIMSGTDQLPGVKHYLIGDQSRHWQTDVPTYRKVRYDGIYPGISLSYYGSQQHLEYDFEVAPGADPALIRLVCHGASPLIDSQGDLVLKLKGGELRQHKPVIYQELNGQRAAIEGHFVIRRGREIGFEIGEYDTSRPLVIDPTLVYSTYLGAAGIDSGSSIDIDNSGNIYLAGTTSSTTFPAHGSYQPSNAGLEDVFVTKLDPSGGSILYSTYIGGSSNDRAAGIFVDRYSGAAYVVGRVDALSSNFPTTAGAFATTYRGGDFDAFVLKLNSAGNSLVYSTFLGGQENDSAVGVAADSSGNAYVTGGTRSTGFPATPNAYQPFVAGDTDGYLVKFNATGTALLYATLLGGGGTDRGSGVAIDSSGNAYVDGYTGSMDFPTENAFQNTSGGSFDAFVAKVDTAANGAASLVFSSYLGGAGDDKAYGITIDSNAGNVFLAGQTSSNNFPVLNAAQPANGGNFDGFVAKISSAGAKVYATYLGGGGDDRATGIAINSAGEAYLTGLTSSTNFPTVNSIQAANGGASDAFVAKLNSPGGTFLYSTYLGGSGIENSISTVTSSNPIALDAAGNAYVTGYTASSNFPTISPLQAANAGSQDAFIAKISDAAPASLQFSSNSFSANEGDGSVEIAVTRTGNTVNAVDIDYATSNGSASSRTDYTPATGTLHFAAGEVLKKYSVPLVDDLYVEANETVTLTLRNPQGGGAFIGNPATATLTILDNDTTAPTVNPLDIAQFFVRQHYLDFLHREPDEDGLAYWTNEITKCGSDAACVNDRRISVSASFFVSDEFQESGGFVYRLYRGTLGRDPTYAEFSADRSKLIGGPDLEANKGVLVHEFMSRPEFADKYSDGPAFIATLADTARTASGAALPNLTSDLTQSHDDCLSSKSPLLCKELTVAHLVDYPDFAQAVYNRSFVIMEYFGYLRRDPDTDGYAFWLDVLNNREPNNYRGMVCSFITSAEYQQRFSPIITRTNAECSGVH